MIDGTEKPKIPSKFAKCAAQYNEFGYKYFGCQQRESKNSLPLLPAFSVIFIGTFSNYGTFQERSLRG